MWRSVCTVVAAAVLLCVPVDASATDVLGVKADRTRVETQLGHRFEFRTTITNRGAAVAAGYIAHLNVLSDSSDVYVDPEDWSGERTRYLRPIPPGHSTTLRWQMQAVNAGRFAVYVAVLPQTIAGGRPTTSPAVEVTVADRTTLNSGGILPLALGVPALLGAAWLALRMWRRRGS